MARRTAMRYRLRRAIGRHAVFGVRQNACGFLPV